MSSIVYYNTITCGMEKYKQQLIYLFLLCGHHNDIISNFLIMIPLILHMLMQPFPT